MGLSLTARATRSFNSFGVVADNDLQSVLDLRLQFSYSNLSAPPGTTCMFLVSPAADLSARFVWAIPTIPPNALCQHLQPGFLLFPAMSLVLNTDGRP
jgi:hypothetical protein